MTDPADPKKSLRKALRAAPPEGNSVLPGLSAWLGENREALVISAFAPLPDEPDILPLVTRFPERRWVFPRVVDGTLHFHEVRNLQDDLTPGAFGIREPHESLPVIPVGEIDVFLCPGMAFDREGGRLGRGLGFYDRILRMARPDAVKIGVAARVIARVPMDAHDIRMNVVIS